jgi:peptidoglycan/LPS O-acetylase OafA/YrhL
MTSDASPARWLLSPVRTERGVFYSIDAVRGLAAMAVVIYHYKNFFRGVGGDGGAGDATLAQLRATPLFEALRPALDHGVQAVTLFWIISGFVFAHVYGGRRPGGRDFAVARIARLYPLHFATLLLVAGLQAVSAAAFGDYQIYQHQDLKHFALQLIMASNWGFEDGNSFNGPIWSVSAEIAIYAVFFAALRLVPLGPAALAGLAALFGALFFTAGGMIALCGLYFFVGALVYAAYRVARDHAPGAGLALAWGLCAAGALLPGPETVRLIAGFGGLVAGLALLERRLPALPFTRLQPLGDISYSIYLLHTPLQISFLLVVAAGAVPLSIVLNPVFAVVYLLTVALLGRIVFVRFERPAQRMLRARLGGGRRPAPAQRVAAA